VKGKIQQSAWKGALIGGRSHLEGTCGPGPPGHNCRQKWFEGSADVTTATDARTTCQIRHLPEDICAFQECEQRPLQAGWTLASHWFMRCMRQGLVIAAPGQSVRRPQDPGILTRDPRGSVGRRISAASRNSRDREALSPTLFHGATSTAMARKAAPLLLARQCGPPRLPPRTHSRSFGRDPRLPHHHLPAPSSEPRPSTINRQPSTVDRLHSHLTRTARPLPMLHHHM
jgi:hypothetical protein